MSEISRLPLRGEIIPPGIGVTLVLALHPLKVDREVLIAPAGLTLVDLLAFGRARSASRFGRRHWIEIDGHRIDGDLWRRVRPKPGTTVLIRGVAQGDTSNLVRNLLTLAVGAAAIFAAGPIAAAIGLAGVTVFGVSATALVGAAITVGGQLLVNALFPVAQPQLATDSTSQTYSLSGGGNSADPFGTVPVILGKNRYYPKLGALTYTEFLGDDQYLRMLVVWGYGPLDISDIKIGETLLSDYADVDIETRLGYPGEAPVTLYPGEVIQTDLSVDITAAAGWQVRTTATAIDEIALDFVAPGGIVNVDSSGAAKNYTVSLRVEYSPTGAGAWSLLGTLDLTARSTDALRRGITFDVANGQYDVRVEKTSADYTGSNQVQEDVVWTALRGYRNTPPISFSKPLAVSALRIRATSQLNGAVDQLNGINQSKAKSWDGANWDDDTVTNNPADLFRLVLQSPANAKPQPDSKIDLETLEAWSAYCNTNGFTFNMVRDFTASVYDTLTAIAAAGRAVVVRPNGKWSVVWDDPTSPIVQHFTPRNSWGFSGTRTYVNPPHAFRVQFVNANNGYQQDERIVYDDGYNADGSGGLTAATLFEQVEFPGVTDPDIVWKMGRFHIAQARLRPEIYSLNVDVEQIVSSRGDRVYVAHDVIEVGLVQGRVKSVAGQVVTVDEPVTMATGTSYAIRFRLRDGTSLLRNVVTDDGEQTSLTLSPADANQSVPQGPSEKGGDGELFLFGTQGTESMVCRVRSVTPADDLSAAVTLVDDAPAISDADKGAIPAFDSNISPPADPFAAAPINLKLAEVFEGVAGATASGVVLTWETVAGEYPMSFDTEYRDDGGDAIWKDGPSSIAPAKTAFLPVTLSGAWSFRVRCVFASGAVSQWAELDGQPLVGIAAIPLADVTNLRTSYQDNTSALTWDEITDFRDVRYEIRKGDSWESALVLVGDQAHPPFATYGDGTYWIAGVARPLPGVITHSPNPASITISGSVLVANVVATYDEAGTGWTGTVSGPGTITSGLFETTAANTQAYYEIPAGHVFDVGFARPTRLNAIWKATGVPANQNVLTDPDFLNNPDVLGSASARLVDAWVEIAVAQSGSSDVFALPDAFAPSDIFAGGTTFANWQKFAPGVYVGQFFRFRLVLVSNDASVIAAAVAFTVSADVPDRNDHVTNHALASGGETFTFTPDGSGTATPFKGGPNSATVPNVQVTWNQTAGDQLVISGLTLSGVTLQILNGGVGVARTINAIFQGW